MYTRDVIDPKSVFCAHILFIDKEHNWEVISYYTMYMYLVLNVDSLSWWFKNFFKKGLICNKDQMLHLKLHTHGKSTFSMNTLFAQFTHIICLNPALLPRIWLIQIRIICIFIFKLSSWHWPNNVIIFLLLACMFDKILLRVMYLVLPQIPKE